MSATPVYRLIHGLPGAGKTEVFKWLRSYFEDVWQYRHGDEFVFVARMNSMADNIQGTTLHSYWKIAFQSHQGCYVNLKDNDDSWTSMVTKLSLLQWIFIDEIETADIGLLAQVENKQTEFSARPTIFKRVNSDEKELLRPWGGVNVMMTGDWWQLHP